MEEIREDEIFPQKRTFVSHNDDIFKKLLIDKPVRLVFRSSEKDCRHADRADTALHPVCIYLHAAGAPADNFKYYLSMAGFILIVIAAFFFPGSDTENQKPFIRTERPGIFSASKGYIGSDEEGQRFQHNHRVDLSDCPGYHAGKHPLCHAGYSFC